MIGDDIAGVIGELRAQAESRMVDSCTVRRVVSVETDPLTGLPTSTYDAVYSGPCEVRESDALRAMAGDSAGSTVTEQGRVLKVPNGAPALVPGDVVDMDAGTATPRLRGVVLRVTGSHAGSWTTAQRVPVEVLSGVPS